MKRFSRKEGPGIRYTKNSPAKRISKKRNTRKKMKRVRFKGGLGEELLGDPSSAKPPTSTRRSKNDSKIRVQFLNPRTSPTPYSVISVLKGPSTGIFDYMWYNINDIEELLSTSMYGLKDVDKLPTEKVYNILHNDKTDELNKEREQEEGERSNKKNRYDNDLFGGIR